MAATEKIVDIIQEKAFKDLERLNNALTISYNKFNDNIGAAIKFNNALGGSKSLKDFTVQATNAEKALEKVAKEQAKAAAVEQKAAQVREKAALAAEKAAARQSKQITEQSRLYTQLSNTLEKLRKDAQDVGVRFGENSIQFQKASEKVIALDSKLKAIDATLGKSQRNVGNYSGALGGFRNGFNGLSNSVNQLTREFPAFTFSVQTGFLALSNNIPIFLDQIQQTQREIKAMRAEGQKVPGLFKQLASSILSFGTIMSIGITLLTVFGKEIGNFIGAMFQGTKAVDAFAERQKLLNKAFESTEYAEASKNIQELAINLGLAKQELISKEGFLKQYNETIGKTTGQVSSLEEAERELVKNGDAYIRVTFLKAAAQLALEDAAKKAYEAEKTRATDTVKTIGTLGETIGAAFSNSGIKTAFNIAGQNLGLIEKTYGVYDDKERKRIDKSIKRQENASKVQFGIAQKFQEDAAKLAEQFGFDFFGGDDGKEKDKALKEALELNKIRLEAVKQASEQIYTNENESLERRLAALKRFSKASQELLLNDQNIQLSESGLSATKKQAIALDTQNKILNIQTDTRNKESQLRKEDIEKTQNEYKEQYDNQIKAAKEADATLLANLARSIADKNEALSSAADDELILLAGQFAGGLIKQDEYAKKRLDIQRKLTQDLINEEIRGVEILIALRRKANDEDGAAKAEKELSDLKKRLSKETASQQIQDLERVAEREKELIEKRKEFQQELGQLAISIVEGQFERQNEVFETQSEQIDIKKAKDIEAAEKQVGTEEEKAARIAMIEARAQGQKEAIERKQRQLSLEKARFDRMANIAGIIGNTARGVTSALALFPPNVPLSILIGAIGAAQIGQVLASPIPKYKDGVNSSNEGPAWVGDGYKHELRIDPDGKMSITPDTPTLTYLKKGTKIIGGNEFQKMLTAPEKINYTGGQAIDINALIASQERSTKQLKEAYAGYKPKTPIITEGAIKHMGKVSGKWNNYSSRNIN